jgi:hypothetical protein
MVGTAYDLSATALDSPSAWGVAALSLIVLVLTQCDTIWVIGGAALAMLGLSHFI